LYQNSGKICEGDLLMVTQNNYLSSLVNGDQILVKRIGKREYRCGLSFIQVEVEEIFSNVQCNLLLIEDILYSTDTNLNTKQHKDLMIDYFQRMREMGIIQKSKAFKDRMLKDPYLNALKCVYGYALTCHKSQGGEWDEVFLYLDKKIHGIPKPSIYQWLYTAITRAKENLYVVDDWFVK
jgi:ATP-dependent exoDNAse (exonuclease V) alpha subunit